MKKLSVIFIILSFFSCIKADSDRYYLQVNKGETYKIDKVTGKTWLIKGNNLVEIKPFSQTGSRIDGSNKDLIKQANSAKTFFTVEINSNSCNRCGTQFSGTIKHWNHSQKHNNKTCIKSYLSNIEGIVDTKGWQVIRTVGNNFLLEYQYSIDGHKFIHPVEINKELNTVKEIISLKQKIYYYPKIKVNIESLYQFVSDKGTYDAFIEFLESEVDKKSIYESLVGNGVKMTYDDFISKMNDYD